MSTSQRGGDHGNRGEPSSTFDSEAVPSLLAEQIVPVLHAGNEVESSNARIAFVCRSYALQKVKRLDPTFRGRGVHQFQSRLERHIKGVNDPTSRDALEMNGFDLRYYKQFIQALENDAGKADCAQLTMAYQIANALFEVLEHVKKEESSDPEILTIQNKVAEKMQIYIPYNILPLDPASTNRAIMKYPEIQAAVVALRETRGLPWPEDHKKKQDGDILDWLQATLDFRLVLGPWTVYLQKDNVANQREHLILLLANVHNRKFPNLDPLLQLDDRALTEAWEKLFMNYDEWCKFLNRKSSLW